MTLIVLKRAILIASVKQVVLILITGKSIVEGKNRLLAIVAIVVVVSKWVLRAILILRLTILLIRKYGTILVLTTTLTENSVRWVHSSLTPLRFA